MNGDRPLKKGTDLFSNHLLPTKKTEQPDKRQLGSDGAGNPAISLKSFVYSEKIHNVLQTTSMGWGCQGIVLGKR